MGLARSPRQYFRVIKGVGHEWQKINRIKLNTAIRTLYKNKLVRMIDNDNGTTTLVLTDAGRKKVLIYNLDKLEIEVPKRWDGFWRVIIFDIPEKHKPAREALREKLKGLGFYQLQKSIFVHPYECKNKIDFIIEVFKIRPWVRYMMVKHIDNELHLKKIFSFV